MPAVVEFVFLHSYWGGAGNWEEVMLGMANLEGRLATAGRLSRVLGVPIVANDMLDERNRALFLQEGIENLGTACRTRDEIASALAHSTHGAVLFVSSPDHLPRVARDALAFGANRAIFAASEVAFSETGAAGVQIVEPPHR